jgi:hypothetical protein
MKHSKNYYQNRPYIDEPRKYANGDKVLIESRSPIWGGYSGVVTDFRGGLHTVKVETKPDGGLSKPFHCEIPGSDLTEWL